MKNTKVAFIAHPLSVGMLAVIAGLPVGFIKLFNKTFIRGFLEKIKPFIFIRLNDLVSKTGDRIDFIAVACPLLPDQMVTLKEEVALQKVIEAVQIAEKDGAEIISLGGFTSVIGNEGARVAQVANAAITSGNTYTAMLAIQGVLKAAQVIGLDLKKAKVAVIGATGDIGSACTRFLAQECASMTLAARNEKRLGEFSQEVSKRAGIPIAIHQKTADAINNADVVVSATSALTTIINPSDLKPGAIVCDVALPANIAREVSRQRNDVLVFEGGLSSVPFYKKIKNKKWNILMPTNGIFGCVTEGLLLGFEKKKENYSIGRGNITDEKLWEIWSIALKHGFELSEFFCGDHFYSKENLKYFTQITHKQSKERKTYVSQ